MVKRWSQRQARVALVGVAVVLAVAALAAQNAGESESRSLARYVPSANEAGFADVAASGDSFAASKAAVAAGGGGTSDAAAPAVADLGAPQVVKTATLEVEVAERRFADAFSKVSTIADTNGGFVASSTSSSDGGADARQSSGTLVLRVPAARFDAARTALLELGELRSQEVRGEDVGARITDLDARLRNLRSQEEAMRLLMTKATTVGETIEVQRQLGGVREQIEQLSAEQARLQDAVAMSTISVSLHEPGAAFSEPEPSSVATAWSRAVRGAVAVVAAAIVALGYLLPLLVLAGAGWGLARVMGRLRRTPAPEAAGS